MVLQNVVCLHRSEGAKANVQGDKGSLYAFFPDFVQQFVGKVQSSCRSRRGADFPGVNRLIPLLIRKLCLNIGRQGHLSQAFQNFQKDSLIEKFHHPVSVFPNLPDNCL